MAERKGPGMSPGGDEAGESEHVVSGQQQDDRTRGSDERDVPARGTEDSELTENLKGPFADGGTGPAQPEDHETLDETGARQQVTGGTDGEFGDEPVDLSALRDDDALLDSLGGADPDFAFNAAGQLGLESLLVAWRQDIDSVPIGELVDAEAAVSAIAAGREPRARKRRHLVPVASAAAVLMITFAGVGAAARDAMPGDALWGVAQVLYADHARSAQAATDAQTELLNAGTAWDQGRRAAAEAALRRAHEQIQTVEPGHGRQNLQASYASLTKKFGRTEPPAETSPLVSSTTPAPSSSSPVPTSSQAPGPVPPPSSTTGSPPPSTSSSPSETSSRPPSTTSQPSSGNGGWGSSPLWPSSGNN